MFVVQSASVAGAKGAKLQLQRKPPLATSMAGLQIRSASELRGSLRTLTTNIILILARERYGRASAMLLVAGCDEREAPGAPVRRLTERADTLRAALRQGS